MIRIEQARLQYLPSLHAAMRRRARLGAGFAVVLAVPASGSRLQSRESRSTRSGSLGRQVKDMSSSVVRRVGIVGLGKMGRPMARHLRKAGFEVTGCDLDETACREA
jgi:phosphoglycerate dehydrogenase-like enzyme